MIPEVNSVPNHNKQRKSHPFRRAVLRGVGVVLPPLLTIVFFLWLWSSVQTFVLTPIESGTRWFLTWRFAEVLDEVPKGATLVPVRQRGIEEISVNDPDNPPQQGDLKVYLHEGARYVMMPSGEMVPSSVYRWVARDPGETVPVTATAVYRRYIDTRWLRRWAVVAISLCVFVLLMYLLGKLIAVRLGRILWTNMEVLINHVPILRTVYGSVKQVTNFVFGETEIEYTRVVALEYPRKGIWSIGFVTSENMMGIRDAAGEPVSSVFMPTSPFPGTGFTVTLRKNETIDLNISVDQAFQFIVSCGVVVPTGQDRKEIEHSIQAMVASQTANQSSDIE